jgi:VWFA-related protein
MEVHVKRLAALVFLLFPAAMLLAVLALAQQPASQPAAQAQGGAPDSGLKIVVNRQLVVEIVSVKDKSGKIIEGLTAKDFAVTEDGKPQDISFCEFQKLSDEPLPMQPDPVPALLAATAPKPAAPPKTDVAPVSPLQIAPEKPGDIRYRDRRLIALYFDMSAMPVPDQLRALAAAQRYIRTHMTGPDLMAIMVYNEGNVRVLQDFTGDRDLLNKSIDKLVVGEGQGFDEDMADASGADTGSAFGQDNGEFNIFNTDRQLAALQTAVKMLGTLNEKKALVYFASGMHLNGVDNQAQLQATENAAIRANVSFFPVDARGLVASAPMGDATRGSPGGVGMYNGAGALAMMSSMAKSQDTMWSLAADTGGKALLDNNDLGTGIMNAEQSISSYYILGYYTSNENLDGKFRRIKITLTRSELAASLNFRQGYYANKQFGKFSPAEKERQLEDALMMGDPVTELTIAMELNYFQLNRAEYFVPLVVKIPGSELALARKGGYEHTLIDFIGEVKDEYGTTVSNVRDKIDVKINGETAAELVKHPVEYDTGFTLLPGNYFVKFLARDAETGRIGTYMHKFVVPNLNREEKQLPISSVVLASQRQDLRDSLFSAGKESAQALAHSVNPLVENGVKLIPSVTRVFSRSRDLYVYLQAYERGATSTQPLVAYVTFYRGHTKAFETPPLPVTEGLDAKTHAVPLRFSLALSKLPPGKYDCQVSVVDPGSQKAAFWQAPVMLVP